MDIEEFYAADERRRQSAELEFGRDWNDENGRCGVSWVEDTGEVYLMREPSAAVTGSGAGDLELVPHVGPRARRRGARRGRRAAARSSAVMSGWEQQMPRPTASRWLRDRVAARGRRTRTTRRALPPTSCPTTRTEPGATARRPERRYPRTSGKRTRDTESKSGGHVEVEIGIGKSGRRAYGFDDIAIVPSRRTRDPEDVDITWEVDAFKFELPMMAAAMDGVVSPATAIEIGRLGGLACLNLEGLWTRYEDPDADVRRDRVADAREGDAPDAGALRRADQGRAHRRSASARSRTAASPPCASLTPQRVEQFAKHVLDAELDVLVVQGTVVSAEHVSQDPARQPLNLKKFIREFDLPVIVGGCASYSTALHLMRTGAVGVLVGVGPGHACTTRGVLGIGVPQATAIADAAGARIRYSRTGQQPACTQEAAARN